MKPKYAETGGDNVLKACRAWLEKKGLKRKWEQRHKFPKRK